MNIYLMILLFLGSNSHDIQVAHYKIEQEDQQLVISFVFGYEDILSVQKSLNGQLSEGGLQDYIKSNFAIAIDRIGQNIAFDNMLIKNGHIYVEGRTPGAEKAIDTMEITNTCLIDIEGHSNIIEVSLHDMQRDFLMNRARTRILINY